MIELQPPDWWEQIPVLSGASLIVREVEHDDVSSLFELLSDPQVTRFISPPPPSRAAFAGFVAWAHSQRESGSCVCFAVLPKGLQQAIGLFQLRALDPTFRTAEWGFAIGSAFWSTGVFQEAAVLVARFAFEIIGVRRLEARAVVENARGNRALEKIGARGEAVLRKAFHREQTQFLWAMLAGEWTPPASVEPNAFDAAKLQHEITRAIAQQAAATDGDEAHDLPLPFPFFLTDSGEPPEE